MPVISEKIALDVLSFLDRVYALSLDEEIDDLDLIESVVDYVVNAYTGEGPAKVDYLLLKTDCSKMRKIAIASILRCTFNLKEELQNWTKLKCCFEQHCLTQGINPSEDYLYCFEYK